MSEALELQAPQPPVDVDALDTAKPLVEIFQPYQTVLEKWEAKVQSLTVTNIDQKTEMAQARLARLELKVSRIAIEKTRVGLVSKLKERTAKIDTVARQMRQKFEELEAKLLESEQFAERHAAKLKAELKAAREAELVPLLDSTLLGDLSDLTAEQYAQTLTDAKLLRQAKIDAAARAEAEAMAKAEADRVERERVAAENARLKAEAIETARLADLERRRVEAEMAEERRKAVLEIERLAEVARVERERVEAERAEERRKAADEAAREIEANRVRLREVQDEADRLVEKARKEREMMQAEAAKQAQKEREEREAIEADAREKAAKAAKETARLKADLAAKEKAEKEQAAKIEADRVAAEAVKRAAAIAPDQAKLKAFAATVRGLALPAIASTPLRSQLAQHIESLARFAEAEGAKL